MKGVRKLLVIGMVILSSLVWAGDKDRKEVNYEDLVMTPHDVNTYVFFDELSLMGDFGEGGGVGKKWWRTFRDNIYRRILNIGDFDLLLVNGKRFFFEKDKMPKEQFQRLELKPIAAFYTKDRHIVKQEIYSYYVSEDAVLARPLQIKDLQAIELIDGSVILNREIDAINIELIVQKRP